jgi:recombinational DNA repair ATPase RecF
MSELDPEHREHLVRLLAEGGQALITATEAEHIPSKEALRVAVDAGSVSQMPALRAA